MATARSSSEQSTHDRVVCTVAERLYQQGYDIGADAACSVPTRWKVPCFAQHPPGCDEESCRIPDVVATARGRSEIELIVEVETESSLGSRETKCQLSTFAMNGRTAVMVPQNLQWRMQQNLREWGLGTVEVWGY